MLHAFSSSPSCTTTATTGTSLSLSLSLVGNPIPGHLLSFRFLGGLSSTGRRGRSRRRRRRFGGGEFKEVMARLHQAASAVKNKVQGTLTNCFSHKHHLVEGDEHEDGVDPPTSSSRDVSDESERSSSLGPSVSNLTEYFDADGTGSDIDMSPEEEFEESGGKGGLYEGHLDNNSVRNGNYLHSGEMVVEKQQQQQQDSSQLHTKNHRHYLHHRGALPGDMVQVDEEKVAAMRATLVEDPSLDQKKVGWVSYGILSQFWSICWNWFGFWFRFLCFVNVNFFAGFVSCFLLDGCVSSFLVLAYFRELLRILGC